MITSDLTCETADAAPAPNRQTLEWHEGDMPYSSEFGDHFYCREDGRLECEHVFLGGNDLPQRWSRPAEFIIGELGFGTGLNFCETWRQWKKTAVKDAALHFVSFERFPMTSADIDRALSRWPDIEQERKALCMLWPRQPGGSIDLDFGDGVRLTVICGNALDEVAGFSATVDAWYLDGFAPRLNPDMWSEELMQLVFSKTAVSGTFATYAAAGFVRRNLKAAGFVVERRPGFGNKREMLCGIKSPSAVGLDDQL